MGMDVYATSELRQDEQKAIDATFVKYGLESNLRRCGIRVWKSIFELCTNTHCIEDLAWSKVSSECVHEFYMYSKEFLKTVNDDFCIDSVKTWNPELPNATNADVNKMCKFLEICNEYEATLFFC